MYNTFYSMYINEQYLVFALIPILLFDRMNDTLIFRIQYFRNLSLLFFWWDMWDGRELSHISQISPFKFHHWKLYYHQCDNNGQWISKRANTLHVYFCLLKGGWSYVHQALLIDPSIRFTGKNGKKWGKLDLNQRPAGYESVPSP